jgi:hypothetical protein
LKRLKFGVLKVEGLRAQGERLRALGERLRAKGKRDGFKD